MRTNLLLIAGIILFIMIVYVMTYWLTGMAGKELFGG